MSQRVRIKSGAAGAGLLLAGAAAAAWATAGDLDATFGTGGIAQVATGNGGSPDCVVQADGKVVVGGFDGLGSPSSKWRIGRWTSAGTLDGAFGSGGFTTLFGVNGNDTLQGVALDAAGRILAAGRVRVATSAKGKQTTYENRATVARLLAGGSPDTGFGSGGSVTFAVPGTTASEARCIATQADGKIVVAGHAYPKVRGNEVSQIAAFVARLNANGTLDTSFGAGGVTVHDISATDDQVTTGALAFQSNGKIVLATTHSVVVSNVSWQAGTIVRFTASGAVDTAFGAVSGPNAPYDSFRALAVDANDGIVTVGRRGYSVNVGDMLAMRFGPNGTLDTSFGSGGATLVAVASDSFAQRVAIQGDGGVVCAGYVRPNSPASFEAQSITARLLGDGTLDTSYGTGGVTAPLALGADAAPWGLSIAPDGRTVVSGRWVATGSPNTFGWFVARYLEN